MTLRFKGKLKWHGKRGRLEVIYNDARRGWYAHITVKVGNVAGAKGSLRAGVDLARHRQRRSRKLRLLYDKRRRFLRHALNSMVRKTMEELKERGVRKVVVGYPKGVAKNHGNKLTVNFWNYSYIIKRFKEIGEELGIGVIDVAEPNTSKDCSLCGDAHKNGRIRRGLYRCPRMGKAMNADLNGAVNILHIPESLGSRSRGQLPGKDRGNGLKTQPVVYRWTNGAGWVQTPTSYEVMKMKAVNRKPVIRPKGTLAIQGGEEVRSFGERFLTFQRSVIPPVSHASHDRKMIGKPHDGLHP